MLKESSKEIVKVFIKNFFHELTLEQIKPYFKDLEESSIDQRIRRDPDVFEWSGKPKKILIKPKLPEIVFFKQKNYCFNCRKQFPEEKLVVTHKSLDIDDVDAYDNLAAICIDCANIVNEVSELTTIPISIDEIERYSGSKWEYKRVIIRKREVHQKGALEPTYYYVFQEDRDDPRAWKHIAPGDKLESVLNSRIQDIMNYYGKQGWECIHYEPPNPPEQEEEYEPFPEEFNDDLIIIFKRES